MSNRLISRIMMVTTLVMVLALMAACAPAEPEVIEKEVVVEKVVEVEAKSALEEADLSIAALIETPVNDAGWGTLGYQALIHMRDTYGFDVAYTESVEQADAEEIMREYVNAGFDVVYSHGMYFDQIYNIAKEYPDTKFVQVHGWQDDLENLYTPTLSAGEGGYFMGRLACQITESGKVSIITGMMQPTTEYHIEMFEQACADIGREDVETNVSVVGSWDDPTKAREMAEAALDEGVDIIVAIADAGDLGIIEALQEASDNGEYVRGISWSKDKNYLAPEVMIGGWREDVTQLMEYSLEKIAKGDPGGHFAIGLKEDASGIEPFYGLVSPEIEEDIITTLNDYLEDPSSVPNLAVRTDL